MLHHSPAAIGDRDLSPAAATPLVDLENETLVLHYQPIVDLSRSEVVGVEALVSRDHPEQGSAAPGWLRRGAEQPAGAYPAGLDTLQTACRQAADWAAQGLRLDVAVGLSGRQLADPGLVQHVGTTLRETGLEPSQLLLQITERTFTDESRAGEVLLELSDLGLLLGLGDFGTGYSSMLHLRCYPIAFLKIDGTFVGGLGSMPEDDAIVASIASLAAAIGSRCIAEGVQSAEQHAQLLALGCEAQGGFYAPAVPAADLPAAIDHAEAALEGATPLAVSRRARKTPTRLDADVEQHILLMRRDGASLQTIAAALNQIQARHPTGRRWHANAVAMYLPVALAQHSASCSA